MAILFTVEVMVYGKCGSVSGLQLPNGKLLSPVNSSSLTMSAPDNQEPAWWKGVI